MQSRHNKEEGFSIFSLILLLPSSLSAVFSVVTQRSSPGGLRDDTKNSCKGDYLFPPSPFFVLAAMQAMDRCTLISTPKKCFIPMV